MKLPSEVMAYKEEGQTVMSSATIKPPPKSANREVYTTKLTGNNELPSAKNYESTWYNHLFNTHHGAAIICASKGPMHQLCNFDVYCPHGEHTFPHVPTSYNTIGYLGAINDDGRSWAPLLGGGDARVHPLNPWTRIQLVPTWKYGFVTTWGQHLCML